MIIIRGILLIGGIGTAGYGLYQISGLSPTDLRSIEIWFISAILLHDIVFAPICAAAGYVVSRLVPFSWWGTLTCGTVSTATLLLISVPVLTRDPLPGNSSILDRNYPVGLAAALAVVWSLLLLRHAARRV